MKSNIGHLEGASGVAGIIKTIMVLETGVIPPNANFEKLNPKIDADFLRIKVCVRTNVRESSFVDRYVSSLNRILLGRVGDSAEPQYHLSDLVDRTVMRSLTMHTTIYAFGVLQEIIQQHMSHRP